MSFYTTIRDLFSGIVSRCRRKRHPQPDDLDGEETYSCAQVGRDIVAFGKVFSGGAGDALIQIYFFNYVMRINEHDHTQPSPYIMIPAFLTLVASLTVNFVSKFSNARRPVPVPCHLPDAIQLQEYIAACGLFNEKSINKIIAEYAIVRPGEKASWWNPGRSNDVFTEATSLQKVMYRGQSVTTTIYAAMGFLSGIQSKNAVIFLLQVLLNYTHFALSYNEECHNNKKPVSDWYKILLVNLFFTLWLCVSTNRSFEKSNLQWVRENYRKFFIEGEWRNISTGTWIEFALNSITSGFSAFFSGFKLAEALNHNYLCHSPTDITMPLEAKQAFAILSIWTMFLTNGICLGLPASHLKSAKEGSLDVINKCLLRLPYKWSLLHKFLAPAILISAGATGFQTGFLSIVTLPQILGKSEAPRYEWDVWLGGGITGGLLARQTLAVTIFAVAKEYTNLVKELEAKEERMKLTQIVTESPGTIAIHESKDEKITTSTPLLDEYPTSTEAHLLTQPATEQHDSALPPASGSDSAAISKGDNRPSIEKKEEEISRLRSQRTLSGSARISRSLSAAKKQGRPISIVTDGRLTEPFITDPASSDSLAASCTRTLRGSPTLYTYSPPSPPASADSPSPTLHSDSRTPGRGLAPSSALEAFV